MKTAWIPSGCILSLMITLGSAQEPAAPEPPKLGQSKQSQPVSVQPESGAARLKTLVEAAEKAAEAEDWDGASDRVDDAEALVVDWSPERLSSPQISPWLERLKVIEKKLEDDEIGTQQEGEDGLRLGTELVGLSGEDLRAEQEQVKAAEKDAVYDLPIDLNDKVLAWVRLFATERKGFVEGALSRATRYLPMVQQIFQEEGVPKDLAYLAVVESGFKNNAKSRARAVGMWQFIRSTGRIYGLTGNAWVEERRDPVKSARACARYLKNLYNSCGDWYLALVGYNAGPLTTERAIQNLGTRNFWDLARSRWLRNQTKNYVPEILAAIVVGHFPERYGLNVIPMSPFVYETIDVDKMTSLSVLARHAGTDVEILKDLNPELLRASTPPGRYKLRVPPGSGGSTSRALARIPSGQRLDFSTYVIHKGDTLYSVAQRFNVNTGDLLAANNIGKRQFKAGRRIQVPPPAAQPVDRKDLIPVTERDRALRERPVEPLPSIVGEEQPDLTLVPEPWPAPLEKPEPARLPVREEHPARTTGARYHVVKQGETLYSIGMRYGVDPGKLRRWNKLKGNRINIGQRLRLQK